MAMEINMLGQYGMAILQSGPAAKHSLYSARVANAGVEAATANPGAEPRREVSFRSTPLDTKMNLGQGEIIDIIA